MSECFKAQKALGNKYGFNKWRSGFWCVSGGISSCLEFNDIPDKKIWKEIRLGEYLPKLTNKSGKLIEKEMIELPTVSIRELNMCIGFNSSIEFTIGFSRHNEIYFGFIIGDDWKVDITIPTDCEEITYTNYNKLFK
jgi:hypothetical protein